MAKFNVGDRVKVLDKPGWPDGGYKIANWEGKVVEVVADPAGYILMKADKTGYKMLFSEKELEPIQPETKSEQISDHDGTLGLVDALQKKTKGNPAVDVSLDE